MQNENCKLKNANCKVRIRKSDLCVEIDNMSGYLNPDCAVDAYCTIWVKS